MSPDTSRWRSSSDYDYVDQLTAPDIGWEWLRRNEDYQRDYAEFSSAPSESASVIERPGRQWGLRFPCCPSSEVDRGASVLASARRHRIGHTNAGAGIHCRR
ncbi:transcriptional regulator domain-containing protein [Ferrovibrio xuzhouensis]|uniref:Transcriptional regulator domain-containing protein n=1 Tax=Ferrovibrio xuzhouensis TaxID=1576914 RepID=A0ABV7VI66_9PROT